MQGTLDLHHADDIRALVAQQNLWRADARPLPYRDVVVRLASSQPERGWPRVR